MCLAVDPNSEGNDQRGKLPAWVTGRPGWFDTTGWLWQTERWRKGLDTWGGGKVETEKRLSKREKASCLISFKFHLVMAPPRWLRITFSFLVGL